MKNFLVEESERIKILQRHKLIVEQQMPESYNKLMAGWKAGCFGQKGNDQYFGLIKAGNGDWVFQKTTGNQAMKNQGLVLLRIRPDGMYYNTDLKLSRFTTPQPLPNPCPAMTNYGKKSEDEVNNEYLIAQYKKDKWATTEDLRAQGVDTRELSNSNIWQVVTVGNVKLYKKVGTASGTMDDKEAVKNQWIKKLRDDDGIIVNPTDVEKDKYQSVELYKINYSGLPEGLFSPNQLVYLDPTKADPSLLKDKQENESMDRKGCKETIERFYNEFQRTKGRQITNRGLIIRMKDQAQFCKNEFEGKWGIGGGKFDEMIKVLSGRRSGGPSSSGDDSMFRLQ
jgi:hypothetical protein